ncbi:MAG: hypothetical protein Alpg2KO_11420 [Alphaproteobacteria bacterium]
MKIALHNRISFSGVGHSWGQRIEATRDQIGSRLAQIQDKRVIFAADNELEAASCVAFGLDAGLDFGVIEQSRLSDDLRNRFAEAGVTLIAPTGDIEFAEPETRSDHVPGRISVLTSGTTGLPKLVAHTPQTLNTFDRVRTIPENQWFVPYQVGSYAWYQMISLGVFVPDQGIVLGQSQDLMTSFEAALKSGEVTAISSTPTFWRQAAMSIEPEIMHRSPISSISLGGEIVDQAILDYLKGMFPKAAIKHIFASSEAGAAIVVSDGLAGFDASLLDEKTDKPVSIRIRDDRLEIKSRYGNAEADGNWIDTGDLVERVGDRIFFRGRADNLMINVGGQKAFPAVIEAHLLSHPDIQWAQVVAKRAPLVGNLPMANLVLKPGTDAAEAEISLTRFCEEGLPDYAVPRLWNFLDAVPLRSSLKS